MDENSRAAEDLAGEFLGGLPERWRHTRAVARRAQDLAELVAPADVEVLVTAAWLHDIGYAPALRRSGFHPLDGALFLAGRGWPARVAALVAHHSGALFVARVRGLQDQLARFDVEDSAVMDALTYADQTVGPDGVAMTTDERVRDMLARHGPDSPNARAHDQRGPYLRALSDRVRARLAHPGAAASPDGRGGAPGPSRGRAAPWDAAEW